MQYRAGQDILDRHATYSELCLAGTTARRRPGSQE